MFLCSVRFVGFPYIKILASSSHVFEHLVFRVFAEGCLRCTTRFEARVQRPARSPHTAASPTSRYLRNSPTAPRAPSPYSGRYRHRHLPCLDTPFTSKTTHTVKHFTPINIAQLVTYEVILCQVVCFFLAHLQLEISLTVQKETLGSLFNLTCLCLLYFIYTVIHLAKNLYSLMKVNSMFCFTWFILHLDFICPTAPNRETFLHFCTVPSGQIPPPSLTSSPQVIFIHSHCH